MEGVEIKTAFYLFGYLLFNMSVLVMVYDDIEGGL